MCIQEKLRLTFKNVLKRTNKSWLRNYVELWSLYLWKQSFCAEICKVLVSYVELFECWETDDFYLFPFCPLKV